MAYDITAWNINPNQNWYVRLYNGTTGIGVQLYNTEADALAQSNVVSTGISSGFGTDLEVILTTGLTVVSLFQDAYTWYLKVSGLVSDPAKIYLIKQFVELDDIESALFSNSLLIPIRATAEIDAHTHAKVTYDIALGNHMTTLACGDVITLQSTRRSFNKMLQVLESSISYKTDKNKSSLTTSIRATEYITLKR